MLVVLELNGGNDGLNTVVPYGDDVYRKHRPKLQIADGSLHKIDDHVGLHPSLFGLSELLKHGKLAIVQSVGYPNANRSHFESMAIWQTAVLEPDAHTAGWLNRGASRREARRRVTARPCTSAIPSFRVPWRATRSAFLRSPGSTRSCGASVSLRRPGPPAQRPALDRIARMPRGAPGSHLQFVQRSQVVTYASSARIEEILRGDRSKRTADYPEFALAQRLKLVAQLIKAGLATSIYYVQLEGFDTHQNQLRRMPRSWKSSVDLSPRSLETSSAPERKSA